MDALSPLKWHLAAGGDFFSAEKGGRSRFPVRPPFFLSDCRLRHTVTGALAEVP